MPNLRLAAAQLNTVVGDLSGNVERVLRALAAAEAAEADLCVVPELAIPATRPRTSSSSRVSWPTTWPRSKKSRRPPGSARSWSGSSAPRRAGPGWPTRPRSVPAGGSSGIYHKHFLPNYGVFDEQRWFMPGDDATVALRGRRCLVGVSICEDVWFDDGPVADAGRRRRRRGREPQRVAVHPGPAGRAARGAVAAGGRGGLRGRLRQPGGRPGRARLRRRLAGRRRATARWWPRERSSPRTWSWSTCPSDLTARTP